MPTSSHPGSGARRAAVGAFWSIGTAAVAALAQLLYAAITSRLLSPVDFAAYALALVVVQLLSYFGNAGIGNAVQRLEVLSTDSVITALAVALAYGSFAGGVLFTLAQPLAAFWHLPDLTAQLRLLSLQPVLITLAAVLMGSMRRRLMFRTVSLTEMAASIMGMAVALALLTTYADALALATFPLVSSSLTVGVGLWASRSSLKGRFQRGEAAIMWRMSLGATLQNLVHLPILSAPVWAVGRLVGPSASALTSRGWTLTNLPLTMLMNAVVRVYYPLVREVRGREDRLGDALQKLLLVVSLLVATAMGAVSGLADEVVYVLLGSKWDAVADLLPAFALLACVYSLNWASWSFAEADHRSRQIWMAQGALIGTALASLGVQSLFGVTSKGIIAAVLLGQGASHLVHLRGYRDSLRLGRLIRGYIGHAGVGCFAFLVAKAVSDTPLSPIGTLMLGAVVLPLSLGLLALYTKRLIPGLGLLINAARDVRMGKRGDARVGTEEGLVHDA